MTFTHWLATRVFVVIAALGMVMYPAHALQCGDKIVANTTLYTNIGPCPGAGLIIAADNVTLDLNGHAILGTRNGMGVEISAPPNGISGATIKGPGVISGFSVGIRIDQQTADTTIYDVRLIGNDTGISAGQHTTEIRVLKNSIIGRNRTSLGIQFTNNTDVHIFSNTLLGHSEAIRLSLTRNTFLGENLITQNDTGISSEFTGCLNVRGNEVTHNRGDAIKISGMGFSAVPKVAADTLAANSATIARIEETCVTSPDNQGNTVGWDAVQGNTVNSNGGTGIIAVSPLHILVEDNIVSRNSSNGISVVTDPQAPDGSVQVIGNYLFHNGTDLFWNGIGTTDCWRRNIFNTSSPQTLPACQ